MTGPLRCRVKECPVTEARFIVEVLRPDGSCRELAVCGWHRRQVLRVRPEAKTVPIALRVVRS